MSDRYQARRGITRIQILDENHQPVANEPITIEQKSHDFLFGCGAFDALPATDPGDVVRSSHYADGNSKGSEFFRQRMDNWLKVFNYGTIPFYWGGYEPKEGMILSDSRHRAAEFLCANDVRVKGHPLCWHTVCADWLMQYDNATILSKQLDRIYREVTEFRGLIDIWDVINEVVIMQVYERYDNAITRICKDLGRVKLVKEVFDAAKSANPDATLLINDFNLSESYRILIDGCLNAGVPISAIGIQTHQHQGYMGREKLEDILDRFSFFGLPIHFTENTLVSGQIMPPDIVDLNDYQVDEWPSTPEGEERQKNEWKEMYEILFAHPLVEAVTGWDFADGAWLNAPSGLVRADGSPKPAYYELRRLIHEEWHTKETLRTDENGFATVEGYCGNYDVSWKSGNAEFHLGKTDSAEKTQQITKKID